MNRAAVSIIICTRNHADSLRETLASIGRCEVPADMPTEVLVVDNGSSDHTREIVESFRASNGIQVEYVLEPRHGKGFAYNTGITHSSGRVLLWTDDDVRVPANWIEGMCKPIAEGTADAVVGGIQIPAHLDRPWLKGFMRTMLACTDNATPQNVGLIGANMAFSRRVLLTVPAFDVELGPGALGFADESLFSFQIKEAGLRIVPSLNVAVQHFFEPSRLEKAAFLEIARRMGRSQAYVLHHWEHQNVFAPRLSQAWIALKLWLRRAFTFSGWGNPDPTAWETAYITQINRLKQFRLEKGIARNYSRRGLRKVRGKLAHL